MTTVVVGYPSTLTAALAGALGAAALDFSVPLPADVDGVVIVVGGEPDPAPSELVRITPAVWTSSVENPLHGVLVALQRARVAMHSHGGRVVVIMATVGMTGSATLVPYTTVLEGVRAMAKSAARQWGRESISVNIVAVPLHLLQPELGYLTTHLTPPALGSDAAVVPAVVASVQLLLSPAGAGLTGATLVADGGSVMAP